MNDKIIKWRTNGARAANIALFSFLYVYLAIYNGYPLVTSDTGAYINNGFYWVIPQDRPITYSLLLRLFSLGKSLWLPVLFQGLLLSILTHRITVVLLAVQHYRHWIYLVVAIPTIALTSVSWFASQLSPDIFTPILAMGIVLYFLDKRNYKLYYLTLIIIAALTHYSNIVSLFIFACTVNAFFFFRKGNARRNSIRFAYLSLGVLLFIPMLNLFSGNGLVMSKSTHVFLTGKLCETGILKSYLEKNCKSYHYGLCDYRDELPSRTWEFVWNENSPLYKMGGWDKTKSEYSMILRDILLSPEYYLPLVTTAAWHTILQALQTHVGSGLSAYREGTNPFWKVNERFSHELTAYMNSRQNMSVLRWDGDNIIYDVFILLTSMTGLLFWYRLGISDEMKMAYIILLSFIIINAFVTANFANVLDRLSSRLVWMLPMLNVIFIINNVPRFQGIGTPEKG